MTDPQDTNRLIGIDLIADTDNPLLQHERREAIEDILRQNTFALQAKAGGPYRLKIEIEYNRLKLDIRDADDQPLHGFLLSLRPYKRAVQDYLGAVLHYESAQSVPPEMMETTDRVRRMLHDEAATELMENLAGKIELDHDTARRLFTLICVLHLGKGQNVFLHGARR